MPFVSIIKGESRRDNIRRSLELIADDVKKGIGERQIVIKPNFVSTSIQLATSHVDQIRGILDFFRDFYKGKVIIAEAACGDTLNAFKNFSYYSLLDEYDVELMDLNRGAYKLIPIRDSRGRTINVRVSSLLLDEDNYLISAAKLKTHDTVVVTLSIKNMAMGSVLLFDKGKVHQGVRQTNLNIAELTQHVWPDLSVIDGFVGMEGNGPIFGDPIHVGIAIASGDPLAADRVACEVMGINFLKVGYLYYCTEGRLSETDINKINVIGASIKECITPFRLHSHVEEQYRWKD
ncbi:MAG: DUF362 domain-containing protein [Nitrospirae bacterium]|nr:DUF362 domain-containing protein [Nitrospirota bacterium]